MLRERIITAFFLLLFLLAAILTFNEFLFQGVIAAIICIGAWEWSRLAGLTKIPQRSFYLVIFIVVLGLSYSLSLPIQKLIYLSGVIWWCLALVSIYLYPSGSGIWNNKPFLLFASFPVLIPGWTGLQLLRGQESYQLLIFVLLGLVAAADIGAYFSGKRFGKHKLAEAVSPNKTWEGFFGGIFATCVLAQLVIIFGGVPGLVMNPSVFLTVLICAILIAVSSVVGDLLESMLKRQAGIKDSGNILPGHGGILDRIDGITAAVPVYTGLLLGLGLL